ncbi:bicaudal D-related protein homolog [Neocloeon triangulifer]|uniref:bicaudal D-related protein homolog n=1 Tax=Neocloeon triangulifer TaxID=2078957 RepID=UPI00286EE0BC|nr:bicaudal D-related protein homolog [Neocloeon triangulifer]
MRSTTFAKDSSSKKLLTPAASGEQFDLEDYIYEMQRRNEEISAAAAEGANDDVYSQLAQKEKDLILAAELGKALLERNQELTRQHEKMTEDFSRQLEALEQEKHSLRRQLTNLESESETKIMELSADVKDLKGQVARREEALKQAESAKTKLITELTEQNQRLTAQLKESRKREERLSSQLTAAREQFSLRKTSLQDHESHAEILREELDLMSEKCDELERQVADLQEERVSLQSSLDEANERAHLLQKRFRDHEHQLRHAQRDSSDLRSTPRIRGSLSPASAGQRSLLSEMETSSDDDLPPNLSPPLTVLELQREALSAWRALRGLCRELRKGEKEPSSGAQSSIEHLSTSSSGCSSSSEGEEDCDMIEDEGLGSLKAGRLSRVVSKLCRLVREGGVVSGPELLSLQAELHRAKESLAEAGRMLEERAAQLRRNTQETMQLQSKLGVCEAQLSATIEERDLARSDVNSSGEEALNQARALRDTALAARNSVQVELARTRIDVLQVNSQLMEAVQQKIELSQQLEQWQMDMQLLLDDQMRQKLTEQEKLRRSGNENGDGDMTPERPPRKSTSRLLSLFSR